VISVKLPHPDDVEGRILVIDGMHRVTTLQQLQADGWNGVDYTKVRIAAYTDEHAVLSHGAPPSTL